jgi:hypothetical protein
MVTRLWIKHKGKIYHAGEMLPEDFTSRDRFRNIHPSRVSAIQVDPAEVIPEPPELPKLPEAPEATPPITTDDEPVVNTEEEVEVKDETQNEAQEQIESEDESKEEEAVTDQKAPEETSEEEKRVDAPISKSVGLSSSIKGTKPAAKNAKKHPGAPAGKK